MPTLVLREGMLDRPRLLPPDAAHLWLVSDLDDPALLAACRGILSPAELARNERLQHPSSQHQHLVAHALVRVALSCYAPVPPQAWSFAEGPNGKPVVAGPPGAPPLAFNLSHTSGLVACLVALDREIGVDVEDLRGPTDPLSVGERFLGPGEAQELDAFPIGKRREQAFALWTLKEAYTKARGLGLGLPLDAVCFSLGDGPPTVRFLGLDDRPEAWHFSLHRPDPDHLVAVAASRREDALVVEVVQALPWLRERLEIRDPSSRQETVVHRLEEQAALHPEVIAIEAGGASMSYAELDRRSNRLARYIRAAHGEGRGRIVGVLMEHSVELLVAVWGVLKSGHAFLTLDPGLPEQRLAHLLDDTGSALLISRRRQIRLLNRLQWECPRVSRVLCLDSDRPLEEPEVEPNPLGDKRLWDYVGHRGTDPIQRGGWQDSFTGQPFSPEELAEHTDNVLHKLRPYLGPSTRVLEIGCSSGITMFRLAPLVGSYLGTDLSDVILEHTRHQADQAGHTNVELAALPAHRIDTLDQGEFDVVILNSVVQAFAGHNYLRQVLAKAIAAMPAGGVIFLGDLMDLDTRPDLAAALERHRHEAADGGPVTTDLSHELFVSREFLHDLVHELPGLVGCEVSEKIGTLRNELTDYRFDALLHVDPSAPLPDPAGKKRLLEGLAELARHPEERLPPQAGPGDLAYVVYTSGSSGAPKGVLVEHRALANLARWYVEFNDVGPGTRIAKYAGSSFDASIMETVPPGTAGATICVPSPLERLDLELLNAFLEDQRVEICFLPTHYAEAFMELENRSLRRLHTGGEQLTRLVPRGYEVVNHYGPAECTVVATATVVEGPVVTIGSPLPDTRVYLLDEQGCPVADGEAGEILIAGANLARGYLNLPELTAARFVPDPQRPGERMYRTGDRGRRLPDGSLLFLGRTDNQVKVRGCRVEVEEVEAVLREQLAVREAVVCLAAGPGDEPSLTAFVVATRPTSTDELRAWCRGRLPDYMVPGSWRFLEALPVTAHGKVDRRALSALSPQAPARDATGTSTERRLRRCWQEVLGTREVALGDDFFEVGGSSLQVLKAVVEINRAFQVEITAADLFRARSLSQQAALVSAARRRRFVPITPSEVAGPIPASASQTRLYVVQEMDPHGTAYNMPFAFEVRGVLDPDRLEEALRRVVDKHEILRTELVVVGDAVVQRIREPLTVPVEVVDHPGHQVPISQVVADFVRPFSLQRAPQLRVRLVGTGPQASLLLIDAHHALLDGSAVEILWRELSTAYAGGELAPARIQYRDYCAWQRSPAVRQQLEEQGRYWRDQLGGEIPVLQLPLDLERPPARRFIGASHRFRIDPATAGAARDLCSRRDLSLNMLLLGAYQILLARYSGQDDIVTGTPVFGRNHADLQDLLGMFVNTLALRTRPRSERGVVDYLMEVRRTVLEALDNQDHPFEELVDSLDLPRDPSRNPLFDTMFVMQDFAVDSLVLDGVPARLLELDSTTARFDQTWFISSDGGGLRVHVEYDTSLFREPTIRAMAGHFQVLLGEILRDTDRTIGELPVVGADERRRLVSGFNQTVDVPELAWNLQRSFEEAVARHGQGTALIFEDRRWSYAELGAWAQRIAARLSALGCGPGQVVGIAAERSPELIAGVLGILGSGAAILPLSPSHPPRYQERVLADSAARVVLRHLPSGGELPAWCQVVDIPGPGSPDEPHPSPAQPTDLLYVVYTSGTTGQPKGITVNHQTLHNLLAHQRRTSIDLGAVLQFAESTFDVFFQELFGCLLAGGRLLVVHQDERTDLPRLFSRLQAHAIRTVFLPPALVQVIFGEVEYAAAFPAVVQHIVAAGEQLVIPPRLRDRIAVGDITVHNHYGPAETHVVAMWSIGPEQAQEARPPIGRPIANRSLYVLGQGDQLVPPGVTGELCIGGNLTRPCYPSLPELSAQRFSADPFAPGQHLYRTGDLARWRRDGVLEFLGRVDAQVKVRGYRVEPAAIESVLDAIPGVLQSLVVPLRDGASRQLCAYYLVDRELRAEALRARVAQQLPEYMVPAGFVRLEAFPLTANGKIALSALPCPYSGGSVGPRAMTATERRLSLVWQRVLGVRQIGPEDDFFALGGHSLRVLVAVAEINRALHVELSAAQLFRARTLSQQGALVDGARQRRLAPILPVGRRDSYPSSAAQRRMYLLQRLDPDSTAYNMPFAFRVRGALDLERLELALQRLVDRHDILRTDFQLDGNTVVQRVHDRLSVRVETGESPGGLAEGWARELVRPFDLSQVPLVRVQVRRLPDPDVHLLLVDLHHIVMDGSSLEVFWRELSAAYQGLDLGPVGLQYRDYAAWQDGLVRDDVLQEQERFWVERLQERPPPLRLPLDFERGPQRSFEGRVLRFELGAELGERVEALCAEQQLTPNMVLLTAYAVLLARSSGQDDLVVGTPVYGRRHAELREVLGVFVNTLALRLRPRDDATLVEFLASVREETLLALDNQDLPFEELVERLALPRDPSRNPLFDTMFVTQDFDLRGPSWEGARIDPVEPELSTAKFDMSWFVAREGLHLQVEYRTALFREQTIRALVAGYQRLLEAICADPSVRIGELEGLRAPRPEPTAAASPALPAAVSPGRSRRQVEAELLRLWREVLDVEGVHLDTDFFAAGGHSLAAIGLMLRIHRSFGVDLPTSVVFRCPTPRAMAALLGGGEAHVFSQLVQIRAGSGSRRLFCVHPAPGTVLCYRDLARHLPEEWAIYGLQSKGLLRGQVPHGSVEEMATDYIREISQVQPRGPFFLLGWSIGGKIAYEVARQLEARGERVALLALIDTDPVFVPREGLSLGPVPVALYTLRALITHTQIVRHNMDVRVDSLGNLVRRMRMWMAQVLAILRYRPLRYPARGDTVLFQTAACATREQKLRDASRGVRSVIPGLEVVPVGGPHVELFSTPYLEPLAARLVERLDAAGRADGGRPSPPPR